MERNKFVHQIIDTCLEMTRLGLNQGIAGNVSVCYQDGTLITPTGIPYEKLTESHIVFIDSNGKHEEGKLPPSEWRFYTAAYQSRPDANVVVYNRVVHCMAVSILNQSTPAIHYMIAAAGGNPTPCVPYAIFGTRELSEHVALALENRKATLLQHHGLITCEVNLEKALWLAYEVEVLAQLYLMTLATTDSVPVLSDEEIAVVLEKLRTYGLRIEEQFRKAARRRMTANRVIPNETAWFDRGVVRALTDEVKRRGYQKALIVTDKTLVRCGAVVKVTDKMDVAGLAWAIYDGVVLNPTITVVKEGLGVSQNSGVDYLIAIGGGSPQDTCKAIGIISNNPEFADVRNLEGLSPTNKSSVSILTIPTTAGIAAEVIINYVTTDGEKRRKSVCVDPHDIPQVAFIDAGMMGGMPPALKTATGIDALTHVTERYIIRGAWALTDALHIKAIEIIVRVLRRSVTGDKDAGEEMAFGQYAAGMGPSNVGLGLVHGIAHPPGAFYNTPHGVTNAILLPHVMRYNTDFTGGKHRDIARVVGVKMEGTNLEEACNAAVEAVPALNRDVGIPSHLRDVGVREEDTPALAQVALDDVCTGGNSHEATPEDIVELYHTAW